MIDPRRGEIWKVRFDPVVAGEMWKDRPAVVVGVDEIRRLKLRIIVPVTGYKKAYDDFPWIVELHPSKENGLTKKSGADCAQVKSVSEERFQECLGYLTEKQIEEIADAVALCIGL